MFFDLEKFRKCVAEYDDELVLEMAPAAITDCGGNVTVTMDATLTDEEQRGV
jgi:hypothetical protein